MLIIMDISIITVTWNNEAHIAKQLKSVRTHLAGFSFEQFVVDNASADKSAEIAKQHGAIVIKNTENRGFAAANNEAFAKAKGKYVLFLNPDMELKSSLEPFITMMSQEKNIAIMSGKLVDELGNQLQEALPRRQPGIWEMIMWLLKLQRIFPALHNRHRYAGADFTKAQDVESVRGSFMLVRKSFLDQLGFAFDPRYFIWFEDLDLCREAMKRNLRVVYDPSVQAIDMVGQSFAKRKKHWRGAMFTRSMLTYAKKWEPAYKWIWIALLRPFSILLSAIGG